MRTIVYFVSVIAVFSLGCNDDSPIHGGKEDANALKLPQIHVMSYNILQDDEGRPEGYSWFERRDRVIALINYYETDILCAQEDYINQGEDICRNTNFYKVGVSRNEGKTVGNGEFVAIYYNKHRFQQKAWGRFWMSETPEVPSKSWDAAVLRICNWVRLHDSHTNREFYVFNTHLDHVGSEARLRSAELLKEKILKIAGDYPVILAGDMNTAPDTAPINILKNILKDSRKESIEPPIGPVGTFNGMDFNRKLDWRIDYIFTDSQFHVLKYIVPDNSVNEIYPSDHLPVVVELQLE